MRSHFAELEQERDSDGYLVHPDDWDETVARQLAAEWELDLTDEHFKVMRFMRDWFDEHQIIPDVRDVAKYLMQEKGMSKKEAQRYLFRLFPHGYMQQGCQIAGMRRPRGWSVG